ncbi:MAG TPA: fumarylacetoacetate hydrolase family protein [Pirellulales bacterium]|jgi:2-keto-4-pentenoate hydratase/2-oxohepta-3-ene-1,7-dioic acid hydratase in catechol pathway|nr:fumarylacetoacetate hydrolase family protein [Pirellulales bacterium]
MRLISYLSDGGERIAALRDGRYVDLNQADPALPTSMVELLAQGAEMLLRAEAVLGSAEPLPAESVRLLAPVPRPPKIFGVGLNYADHARETGKEPPSEPVIFSKLPGTVAAHGQAIVLPALSAKVDYEAELVVVIGRGGRHIPRDTAMEHVAGYCCGHDVSARDWQHQKPGGQWLLGKSFDTFGPFGPELVTADEIPDPGDLRIQLRLNGQTMQDSSTRQLIFSVAELIAYLSGVCTLEPGDVIFTGTPPGVGAARKPPVYLQPGDVVEIEIERIGLLRNPVVAEPAA